VYKSFSLTSSRGGEALEQSARRGKGGRYRERQWGQGATSFIFLATLMSFKEAALMKSPLYGPCQSQADDHKQRRILLRKYGLQCSSFPMTYSTDIASRNGGVCQTEIELQLLEWHKETADYKIIIHEWQKKWQQLTRNKIMRAKH